jgi:DNA-binding transcriptional ArsR family regulator
VPHVCPLRPVLKKPVVLPLEPLVGYIYVPPWALRPRSYEVLRGLADEMPLWLLIHSRNDPYWYPCYASREQLGATIGLSVRTVTRHLASLREANLLLEVDRGIDRVSRKHRPPARWSLDPFKVEKWTSKLEESLQRIAEDDGQPSYWYTLNERNLMKFRRASEVLAERIGADMPVLLRPKRSKMRKKRHSKGMQRYASLLAPGADLAHEVGFIPPLRESPSGKEERPPSVTPTGAVEDGRESTPTVE